MKTGPNMNRREFAGNIASCVAALGMSSKAFASLAKPTQVAVTMDDFNIYDTSMLSVEARCGAPNVQLEP
jgi:hypothetical protein